MTANRIVPKWGDPPTPKSGKGSDDATRLDNLHRQLSDHIGQWAMVMEVTNTGHAWETRKAMERRGGEWEMTTRNLYIDDDGNRWRGVWLRRVS